MFSHRGIRSFLARASTLLVAALALAACENGERGAAPAGEPAAPSRLAEPSAPTPPAGETADETAPRPGFTDTFMFDTKLKQARVAARQERRNPDGFTVCLKPDGTLATQILHNREDGAPPIPASEKERICSDRGATWAGAE